MPLDPLDPLFYYAKDGDEDDALDALRARMGASYATAPDDDVLTRLLGLAAGILHKATGRWFYPRQGTIEVSGTGDERLTLPAPVVSAEQLTGGGVTAVTIEGSAIDATSYVANQGALPGSSQDPRDNPFLEWSTSLTGYGLPPLVSSRWRRWPYGVGNIAVTATWGYVEEDGTTPEPILHALARLVVLQAAAVDLGDVAAQDDRRRGGVLSESVQGRSYGFDPAAVGRGVTLDREIDSILRAYRRPPVVRVSRGRRCRQRARYFAE